MYDPNIPRWLVASVFKHITDNAGGYPVYLNNYTGDLAWAELRFDGPMVENYEYSSYKIDVTVNILVTAFCGTDEYLIYRMCGIFGTCLDQDICCFKYGSDPQDDQSQFGVLQMYPSKDRKVDTVHYGNIAPDSKFKRSSCEASYTMWL